MVSGCFHFFDNMTKISPNETLNGKFFNEDGAILSNAEKRGVNKGWG